MPLECFVLNITLRDLPGKCEKNAENADKCGPHFPPPCLLGGVRHQFSCRTRFWTYLVITAPFLRAILPTMPLAGEGHWGSVGPYAGPPEDQQWLEIMP